MNRSMMGGGGAWRLASRRFNPRRPARSPVWRSPELPRRECFPVLLDAAPPYLRAASKARSLLLTPMGSGRLLCRLHERFLSLGKYDLAVLPSFHPDLRYRNELRAACGDVNRVMAPGELAEFVAGLEPSDSLLFLDPSCTLLDGVDPAWCRHPVLSVRGAPHLARSQRRRHVRGRRRRHRRRHEDSALLRRADVVAHRGRPASLIPVPSLLTARVDVQQPSELRRR
jgi:hypothetical protein